MIALVRLTLAAAVVVSGIVAVTLSPVPAADWRLAIVVVWE
ncbi:MAG: hypothetical protein WCD63_20975 [Terrimicrobiaceae bacterium]